MKARPNSTWPTCTRNLFIYMWSVENWPFTFEYFTIWAYFWTMLENKSFSYVAFDVIFYELWNNIDILADMQTCMQWWKLYFNFTDLISQCWWSRMNHNLLSEHTCDKPYPTAPFGFLITFGSQCQFFILSSTHFT